MRRIKRSGKQYEACWSLHPEKPTKLPLPALPGKGNPCGPSNSTLEHVDTESTFP